MPAPSLSLGLYADVAQAAALPAAEYSFLEENAQTFLVPEASEEAFGARLALARQAERPVRVVNRFLPPDLRPIGPAMEEARLARWGETTMRRAREAGVEMVVWGSGASRRLEDGFPREEATEQFAGAVRRVARFAERHGVLIVIEPVCRHDSNFIRSLAEGAEIVQRVDHPSVRLLADFWHMQVEGEAPEELVRWGSLLRHVHLSEFGLERGEPGRRGDDLRPYLRALLASGYEGRLVIEANWRDVAAEARSGLAELRRQMREVGYPEPARP